MSLQTSTGKTVNPNLTLGGEAIPEFDGSFKFLGMSVRLHINNSTAKTTVVDDLKRMLEAVDKAPVTRQQKLRLYKQGICPRVSWSLLVEEFPVTWLERHLQPLATRFLKRWAGLTSSLLQHCHLVPSWKEREVGPSFSSVLVQAAKAVPYGSALLLYRSRGLPGCPPPPDRGEEEE